MRFDKPRIFILGGGRGLQSNKLGATTNKHIKRLCIQPSFWYDLKSIPAAPEVSPAPQMSCSHPVHNSEGCSPSPFPCRSSSTNVATNTCSSALEQVRQGHRHPQIHHVLILTSLLAGDNRGGQCCRGNREGNSPVREVFTVFLPDLLGLSPQHTPFFPEEILYPAIPLPHFQTVHRPGVR